MTTTVVAQLLASTFLLAILSVCYTASEDVIVQLNHGKIRGVEAEDENGNLYYAFKGIPYAEAPKDHLRFQPPVPKQPWDGIIDTVVDGPKCPQISMFTNQYEGMEDNCLTLNVYTPILPSRDNDIKLDVVYHIHGGGFACGSGGETFLYNSNRFMQKDKNVVLVSLTYRVSSLGFLATGDAASPGNYGMLDQVEGLRWVRNNIDRFGGDATKVTILGESAGGASVIYHMLSPLSKGLFHRAVAMSGTSVNPWAYQEDPLYWAKDLAESVGCPETDDTVQIVKCLKTKDAKQLLENEETMKSKPSHHLVYIPTTDHHFLPDTPLNIIKNKQYNDVPLLTGVTRDEGDCWFAMNGPKPNEEITEEKVNGILTRFFNRVNVDKAVEKLKEKYFGTSHRTDQILKSITKVVTDGYFHQYHYYTVKLLSEKGSTVYVYSYDYDGLGKVYKKLFNMPADTEIGVCHFFDMANFFSSILLGLKPPTGQDLQMKEQMQKLFFNFILNGTPEIDNEVKWPAAKPDKMHVYHIDTKSYVSIHDTSKDDKYQLWVEEIPKAIHQQSAEHSKEEL